MNVRSVFDAGCRVCVMAAIVATMLYWPLGIATAAVCAIFGFSAEAFMTFGGALGTVSGLLAWWLIAFAAALAYAVAVFPWHAKIDGFGRF